MKQRDERPRNPLANLSTFLCLWFARPRKHTVTGGFQHCAIRDAKRGCKHADRRPPKMDNIGGTLTAAQHTQRSPPGAAGAVGRRSWRRECETEMKPRTDPAATRCTTRWSTAHGRATDGPALEWWRRMIMTMCVLWASVIQTSRLLSSIAISSIFPKPSGPSEDDPLGLKVLTIAAVWKCEVLLPPHGRLATLQGSCTQSARRGSNVDVADGVHSSSSVRPQAHTRVGMSAPWMAALLPAVDVAHLLDNTTGFSNASNTSCYLNSVVRVLFSLSGYHTLFQDLHRLTGGRFPGACPLLLLLCCKTSNSTSQHMKLDRCITE